MTVCGIPEIPDRSWSPVFEMRIDGGYQRVVAMREEQAKRLEAWIAAVGVLR
jgi:hypothetical protein